MPAVLPLFLGQFFQKFRDGSWDIRSIRVLQEQIPLKISGNVLQDFRHAWKSILHVGLKDADVGELIQVEFSPEPGVRALRSFLK
jgi:hypothetical protein